MSGKCVDLMVRYFSAVAVQWMSAPSSEAAVDGVTIHDRHRRRPGGAIRQGDKVVHFAFHGQGRAVVAPMAVPLPAIGSPATGFSVERIMAKIKRIRANEARLLVCFLESPDRSIAIGEMVAVLNGLGGSRPEQPNPVSVDKVMVRRSLRQVRMALIGIGLNQAIVWAAGRYTMSTEAAARITGYLYDR